MSSDSRRAVTTLAVVLAAGAWLDWTLLARAAAPPPATAPAAGPAPLRICADPNNLPFSNDRGEGFENRLAELLAAELGRTLEYTWWPQRRGFVRTTLKAGLCDLIVGVPAGFELAATTRPYYRSSYVFVTRADRTLDIESFDDPRLRALRIGIHVIGDDYSNVPPAQVLAERGLADRVRGYSIYGDYSQPDPPRVLIDAVARGEVDIAVAWGPLAGYFAARQNVPLALRPVNAAESARLPGMTFAIAMGLRRGDDALKARVQQVLDRRRSEVEALLRDFGVPLVDTPARGAAPGRS